MAQLTLSYDIVNAGLAWENDTGLSVYAFASNLLDERYEAWGQNLGVPTVRGGQGQVIGIWLRTGAKWTSLEVFFPVFVGVTLALVSLLSWMKWSGNLLGPTLLGAICGYVACIVAWLIADAVMAPERLNIVRGALRSSPLHFLRLTLFTATGNGLLGRRSAVGGHRGSHSSASPTDRQLHHNAQVADLHAPAVQ